MLTRLPCAMKRERFSHGPTPPSGPKSAHHFRADPCYRPNPRPHISSTKLEGSPLVKRRKFCVPTATSLTSGTSSTPPLWTRQLGCDKRQVGSSENEGRYASVPNQLRFDQARKRLPRLNQNITKHRCPKNLAFRVDDQILDGQQRCA